MRSKFKNGHLIDVQFVKNPLERSHLKEKPYEGLLPISVYFLFFTSSSNRLSAL